MKLLKLQQPQHQLSTEFENHLSLFCKNTQGAIRNSTRRFIEFNRVPPDKVETFLVKCDVSHVTKFMVALKNKVQRDGTPTAPATMHNQLEMLHHLFNWLKLNRYRQDDPTELVDLGRPSHEQKRPTPCIDFKCVWPTIDGLVAQNTFQGLFWAAAFSCLFCAALRRSELVNLRIRDLRTEQGITYLHLDRTKGRRMADIALSPLAATVIWVYYNQLILMKPCALESKLFPISSVTLYRKFKECFHAGCHAARATAITKLLTDGQPLIDVADFSRHRNLEMLRVYDKRAKGVSSSLGRVLNY